MDINGAGGAGEGFFLLQHAHSTKYEAIRFTRSVGVIVLSVIALMQMPDKGWSQQVGQGGAQRFYGRPKENPATPATPAIEPTSPFGQALASCDKDAAN
jgi:hypothetical protein